MSARRKRFPIPLNHELSSFWRKFQSSIGSVVLGQEPAVRKIIRSLVVLESGLQGSLPPSPLLFVGPSGSGKTFLAETIAKLWLGEPDEGEVGPLVKISGENYTSSHEGSVLKGSPPGYVGYEDDMEIENVGAFEREKRMALFRGVGQELFEKIEREYPGFKDTRVAITGEFGNGTAVMLEFLKYFIDSIAIPDIVARFAPFRSILLVDEFEKMHPDIQRQFLGILDTGKLQMLNGRMVDFRGCQIILTGNIGTEHITRELDGGGLGFQLTSEAALEGQDQRMYKAVMDAVKRELDPALYSRIGHGGIVVFRALSVENHVRIIDAEISAVEKHIQKQGGCAFRIHTTAAFRKFLLSLADTPSEGARQIRGIILKHIREPLANLIEARSLFEGDEIRFSIRPGGGKKVVDMRRIPRSHGRNPIYMQREGDEGDEPHGDLPERVKKFLDQYIPDRDNVPKLSQELDG